MKNSVSFLSCFVFLLCSHTKAELSLSFTLLDSSSNQGSLEVCSDIMPPKLLLCALCIDAVESGNTSVIKEYLQNQTLSEQLIYGVDVDGETALIKAAMKNHTEV
jgi:hypothetical protein